MTDDIVKRLRGPRTEQGGLWPMPNLHEEAADEIKKLRAALKIVCQSVVSENKPLDWAVIDCAAIRAAKAALGESDD